MSDHNGYDNDFDERPYLRDLLGTAPRPDAAHRAHPEPAAERPAPTGLTHLVAAATGTPNLHIVEDPATEISTSDTSAFTWATATPPTEPFPTATPAQPVTGALGASGTAPLSVPDPDRDADLDWNLVARHVKDLRPENIEQGRSRSEFQAAIADQPQTTLEWDALDEIRRIVDRHVREATDSLGVDDNPWTPEYREQHVRAVFDSAFRYGRLQDYLREPNVEDISIVGCDNVVVYKNDGQVVRRAPVAASDEELDQLIAEIAKWRGRSWAHPHGDIDLDIGGARLNATAPAGTRRIGVTIRRHNMIDTDLNELVGVGTISTRMREFLRSVVRANRTALISGFTGAGKTTFARAWMAEVDPSEKIVTIETERELDIDLLPHRHSQVEALQYIPPVDASEDRVGGFSLKQAFRSSLRKKAQMILFGEIRDVEAPYALSAMQAGKGSISTIHAENAEDAVYRFADALQNEKQSTDFNAPLRQLMRSLDLVVHLEVIPTADGRQRRVVTEICEIQPDPARGEVPVAAQIYRWDYEQERHVFGQRPSVQLMIRLVRAGLDPDFFDKEVRG